MKQRGIAVSLLLGSFVVGCSASPGHTYLTQIREEPAGANCAAGGLQVTAGPDGDRDGVLSAEETEQTEYVCDGADGTDGVNGTDGTDGVDGADGAPGADGMDGADGAQGANGTPFLVEQSPEPAGANCDTGGTRVDAGPDADGSGALDTGEITSTSYVCNGDVGDAFGPTPVVTAYQNGGVLSSGQNVTVQQATISVPGQGSVVATGQADVFCAGTPTGGGYDCNQAGRTDGYLSVTDDPLADAQVGVRSYFWLNPDTSSPVSRTAVFPVTSAGDLTIYVRGRARNGEMGFFRGGLTLLYIPSR